MIESANSLYHQLLIMLVVKLFFIYLLTELCQAQECLSRDYGYGGTVCVCTSDYCDTIPPIEKIKQPQYLKYTSNKAGLRFALETGTFGESDIGTNTIIIEPEEKFQSILGWGGAFSDATGINIDSLDDDLQENLLKSYFSDDGIEYSLCRVPIGSTDFSPRGYSYDDGDIDAKLANFELAPEDFQYKIPYMKKALELTKGNLQFFASAWVAPKWMMINKDRNGPGYLVKNMYQAWADYFVKFLDNYQKEGITFWGITTGNEPSLVSFPIELNVVGWNSTDMGTWILENLGPAIRNSNHSDINLIILDDQKNYLTWYIDEALENDTTRQYVDGIAFHWYHKDVPASSITETHNHFPEKFILSTEACLGREGGIGPVILGSWDRGESYSIDIIQDLWNWVAGWIDWNMVLDLTGGPSYVENFVDSAIIVNVTAGEFYKQPMFYHLGHFSKFIPVDSIRIASNSTLDQNVMSVAFQRPDNGTVVVILNRNDEVVPLTIVDSSIGVAEVELSEKSITTLLYW